MKSSGLLIGIIMALVAAGVYFGLEYLSPKNDAETAAVESTDAIEPAADAAVDTETLPDETAPAEMATEPAPETLAEMAPAEPAEAAAAAESAPVSEPPADVAMAEPASAPDPVPAAKPIAPRKSPPPSDAITRWWPEASQMPRSQLKLLYAGQAQDQRTIALLFSEKLDPDTFEQNIKVLTADGQKLKGDWTLGKNERMAMFKVGQPGRYTVVLKETLADITDHILGTPLQGPVYIQ